MFWAMWLKWKRAWGSWKRYKTSILELYNNKTRLESQVRERQETREAKPGLSDDDKIRLQLYVDVHFLLKKLREIGAIEQVN